MPDILHLISIGAPREAVYGALTTPEGVRAWWTRDADLAPGVGGTGNFRFYGGKLATQVRVAELEPPVRVVWTTTSSFRPEWMGTTIVFDLRASEDGTVLAFAHRGFAEPDDIYAMTTTGWAYYLVSLQQYVETGDGAPDVDFTRMLRAPSASR